MRWAWVSMLVMGALAFPMPAHAAIEDVIEATCRLRLPSGNGFSTGTGCAFEIADGEVRILTNYHVAENSPRVQVEFWHRGHQSTTLVAASRWFSYHATAHRDICIVAVPLSDFGDTPPAIMPLAPRGTVLSANQPIVSCGCEEGRWPSAWRGHIVDYADNAAVRFQPKAIPGRSGSAVFDEDAQEIVGLIAWHDGTYGVAMTIEELYRAFDGQSPVVKFPSNKNPPKPPSKADSDWRPIRPDLPRPMTAEEVNAAPLVPVVRRCVHGVPLTQRCSGCSPFGCPPPQPQAPRQPNPPRGGGQGGSGGSGVYPTLPPGKGAAPAPPAAPSTPPPPPIDTSQFALKSELAALQAQLDALKGLPSSVSGHSLDLAQLFSQFKQLSEKHGTLSTDLENLAGQTITPSVLQQELGKLKTEAIAGAESQLAPLVKDIGAMALKAAEAKATAVVGNASLTLIPTALGLGGPVGLALVAGAWLLSRAKAKGGASSNPGGNGGGNAGGNAGGSGGATPGPFQFHPNPTNPLASPGPYTPAANPYAQHGPSG